jgi:nucleoid DNA-binding protein
MNIDELDEAGNGNALTKRDLVTHISKETGITQQDVRVKLAKTLHGIVDALEAGKHVEFREFGVFEVTQRKARIGRYPNKPAATVTIPERKVVKFKPGKRMRQMLAGK